MQWLICDEAILFISEIDIYTFSFPRTFTALFIVTVSLRGVAVYFCFVLYAK